MKKKMALILSAITVLIVPGGTLILLGALITQHIYRRKNNEFGKGEGDHK